MNNGISAVVFSMDKPANVIAIVNKIVNSVNEVIIIDSSNDSNYQEIKKALPNAHVEHLPRLGMADLYYRAALNLSKYEWIIHIEDDEIPSDDLINSLPAITKGNVDAYRLWRLDEDVVYNIMILRIFRKDRIIPTGIIHWCWACDGTVRDLDKNSHVRHAVDSKTKDYYEKLKWYAEMESWTWGCKFMHSKNTNKGIFAFFRKQSKFGYLGWYLMTYEFALFLLFEGIKNKNVYIAHPHYLALIMMYINEGFRNKVIIWKNIINAIDPIHYLELDTVEQIKAKTGMGSNGKDNFRKLIRDKINISKQ